MLTDNILELIGNTPLVRLKGENIYAKAEFLNPGGSIKDRVAVAMLEAARRDGERLGGPAVGVADRRPDRHVLPDRAECYFSTALM